MSRSKNSGLTSSRELNDLIRQKLQEGWSVKHGKHLKLVHPNYGMVSMSKSPSCPYVAHKVRMDIRRLERKYKLNNGDVMVSTGELDTNSASRG